MTRINVVPPEWLCDQHLLAEYRELTRIPSAVASSRYSIEGQPADYKLGAGHVKFFLDKLAYLKKRYEALAEELRARGFKAEDRWPSEADATLGRWNDYEPTKEAMLANIERIAKRMPEACRFRSKRISRALAVEQLVGRLHDVHPA